MSHAETAKVFQRACVRAGIKIQYSQGFNPRPKLSLPLPRPVGIESDDELLCLRVSSDLRETDIESRIIADLSTQLPEGCVLLSVIVHNANKSFQPCSETYVLDVWEEFLNEKIKATIKRLLASESLNVRRRTGVRSSGPKTVDVRGFLKSIKLDQNSIIVECNVSPAGSIRIEEILNLLELDARKLRAPIRRTNVQWQSN